MCISPSRGSREFSGGKRGFQTCLPALRASNLWLDANPTIFRILLSRSHSALREAASNLRCFNGTTAKNGISTFQPHMLVQLLTQEKRTNINGKWQPIYSPLVRDSDFGLRFCTPSLPFNIDSRPFVAP